MFTLVNVETNRNVAKGISSVDQTDPTSAALVFASKLLKGNSADQSKIKLTFRSPFGRTYKMTVVKQKLKHTYYNGYRFIHYIST